MSKAGEAPQPARDVSTVPDAEVHVGAWLGADFLLSLGPHTYTSVTYKGKTKAELWGPSHHGGMCRVPKKIGLTPDDTSLSI